MSHAAPILLNSGPPLVVPDWVGAVVPTPQVLWTDETIEHAESGLICLRIAGKRFALVALLTALLFAGRWANGQTSGTLVCRLLANRRRRWQHCASVEGSRCAFGTSLSAR